MWNLRTICSKGIYWGLYARFSGGFCAAMWRGLRRRQRLQWRPWEQVRQEQFEKLRALVRHAAGKVPHYRRLCRQGRFPDDLDCPEQMAAIGPLTKDDLRADGRALIADGADRASLIARRSGGSTGEPVDFFISPATAVSAAASELWGDGLAGYRPGDPVAWLWGSHFDGQARTRRQRLADRLANRLALVSDRMDEQTLQEAAAALRSFRPAVLVGYASPLVELARLLRARGEACPGFPTKSIVTAAEPITPQGRRTLEEVFGKAVFNRYGAREVGLIAMECDRHQGLHVDCENLWIDLEPVPGAADGACRILVTRLSEYAMPLIRYELGDYAIGGFGQCSCGRGYPTINHVKGRLLSLLRLKDGTPVSGEVFIAMLDFQPLKGYRVIQQADHSVVIQVVPDSGCDEAAQRRICELARRIVGQELPVRVELCSRIERTASGKLMPVVSHAPVGGKEGT